MELFRFGVIADVQHALAKSGWDFHRTQERHYQFARVSMQSSIESFNAAKVGCVLQLGDLLDGQCKNTDPHKVLSALLNDWTKCQSKILHVLGNHELYCFEKEEAAKLFGVSEWNYSYVPAPGWKIVVADSYGLTTLDKATEMEAHAFLVNHNPNDVRSYQVDWLAGLQGEDRRFVPYNGAFGKKQLEWLEKELDCDSKVILATHIPIGPGSCAFETLVWDFPEVQSILSKSRARVVAVLAGHDHDGGYMYDEKTKIHHVTFQSPMVCLNKGHKTAHAIVKVFETHLEIEGSGSVPSRRLQID